MDQADGVMYYPTSTNPTIYSVNTKWIERICTRSTLTARRTSLLRRAKAVGVRAIWHGQYADQKAAEHMYEGAANGIDFADRLPADRKEWRWYGMAVTSGPNILDSLSY